MAKYSNPEFEIELFVNGEFRQVKVMLELCASGTYDEPMLEEDGSAILEVDGREITIAELDSVSQKRLSEAIEKCIYSTEQDYFSEISQDLAERAADAMYEAWKDRDHD